MRPLTPTDIFPEHWLFSPFFSFEEDAEAKKVTLCFYPESSENRTQLLTDELKAFNSSGFYEFFPEWSVSFLMKAVDSNA